MTKNIVFVSSMNAVPWGGSEVLWSETAIRLRQSGHNVSASVAGWREPASQLLLLRKAGVEIKARGLVPNFHPFFNKAMALMINKTSAASLARWLVRKKPSLICISSGSPADDLGLSVLCASLGIPYVIIIQANWEGLWPNDSLASVWIGLFKNAKKIFFVSHRNHSLLESQLGIELPNSEIVLNPYNVKWEASPPWPKETGIVNLACVARIEPKAKGQDLLLHVLAREPWRSRPITLSLFGKGDCQEGIRRLAQRLKIDGRVHFRGHISDIEGIWKEHHALVLPSRFEGLPLAIVEAMLCGRPVIVTDVAGNAEFVSDGVTGFIADGPSERQLSDAMERAWNKREHWKKIGIEAAKAIRHHITPDPIADFTNKILALISD